MKKIKIVFIGAMFLGTICVGQQKVQLEGSNTIDLPANTSKLSVKEANRVAAAHLSKNKYLQRSFEGNRTYKVGDVLLTINSQRTKVPLSHYLETIKLGIDENGKEDTTYSSEIKSINNIPVLITKNIRDGLRLSRFYCINNANNFIVVGIILYNEGDEEKANTTLKDVIKGIRFAGQ